jgi:Mn2+/Fe2+ NRAMP family transporter
MAALIAVLGTTISPYLFFWQSGYEVEQMHATPKEKPLREGSHHASEKPMQRIAIDTYFGMAFSNLIAYFIILTVAVTLHAHGKNDIDSAAQAAEALRPIAGPLCFSAF